MFLAAKKIINFVLELYYIKLCKGIQPLSCFSTLTKSFCYSYTREVIFIQLLFLLGTKQMKNWNQWMLGGNGLLIVNSKLAEMI